MFAQNGMFRRNDNPDIPDKYTIIIFLLCEVANLDHAFLYGECETDEESTKIFYVVDAQKVNSTNKCIGVYHVKKRHDKADDMPSNSNWIHLEVNNNQMSLKRLKLNNEVKEVNAQQVILIYYDFERFYKSEMFLAEASNTFIKGDHFKNLMLKVHSYRNSTSREDGKIDRILKCFYQSVNFFTSKIDKLTKYSNTAFHIKNHLTGLAWCAESVHSDKKLNVKVVNFLLSATADLFIGMLLLNWLTSKVSLDSFPKFFLLTAETVVNSLKELLQWLTGDPAGFKLNLACNNMLATFFLFNIDIWWTFLAYLKPGLKFVFLAFLYLGQLGITFQTAIIADLLGLVSFHVYCIYAYAARLYYFQISALIALWRLFLGRKKNPLRKKVDSCKYSPEQLFIGTLGFTILLFLLPTTLMYYIVFSFIRISITAFNGILTRIRWLVHSLPIYSTILWTFRLPHISASIQIFPEKSSLKTNFLVLTLKPVPLSWWETVQCFQPDCIYKPTGFNLGTYCRFLVTGRLIHPDDYDFLSR